MKRNFFKNFRVVMIKVISEYFDYKKRKVLVDFQAKSKLI